jgi:hypothetical protein
MHLKSFLIAFGAIVLTAAPLSGLADQTSPMSDSQYVTKVSGAAPAAVVKNATIVRSQGGSMQVLQQGNNGFTCMLAGGDPMCADANAMKWAQAYLSHTTPPDATGFVYMLAGDSGTSNTDPYARAATSDNHWVQTGPHVMIVGAAVKNMGYPMALDANASGPYVMWPNTPYAHLMIPVSAQP